MNRIIFLIVFFLLVGTTYAQKFAVTYYDTLWRLTTKQKGIFYRVGILDTIKYQYNGEVKDFYKNSVLQMKGRYKANVKVDTFYFYYPNGVLKTKGRYLNNVRYGVWTNYYENGKVKDKVIFDNNFLAAIEYYDENGNVKMKQGSGDWQTQYYTDFAKSIITIYGSFKDSLRNGKWDYYRKNINEEKSKENRLESTEIYENGKLVKGKLYNDRGEVRNINFTNYNILPESDKFSKTESWEKVKYLSIESYPYLKFLPKIDSAEIKNIEMWYAVDKSPQFTGGMDKFYAYLHRKLKCVPDKKDMGRKVFVEFVVDSTGYVRKGSVVIQKVEINKGCINNIVSTIENSPKWTPGYSTELKKYAPVRMVIPITL